jgi:hypothetical protein
MILFECLSISRVHLIDHEDLIKSGSILFKTIQQNINHQHLISQMTSIEVILRILNEIKLF